jgi:hypothetical protein
MRDDRPTGFGGARSVRVWLLFACLLPAFAPSIWNRAPPPRPLRLPLTPLDRTAPDAAVQWNFLWEARPDIPSGATYTVLATDPDVEMNLYMMSLAVYTREVGVPNTYFGIRFPEDAERGQFLIDFGCSHAGLPDVEVLKKLTTGCIERRRDSRN